MIKFLEMCNRPRTKQNINIQKETKGRTTIQSHRKKKECKWEKGKTSIGETCLIEETIMKSPFIVPGTAIAAAACILILKLEESLSSNTRMRKTDSALQNVHIKLSQCFEIPFPTWNEKFLIYKKLPNVKNHNATYLHKFTCKMPRVPYLI